jgi:hypothetical protein
MGGRDSGTQSCASVRRVVGREERKTVVARQSGGQTGGRPQGAREEPGIRDQGRWIGGTETWSLLLEHVVEDRVGE